MKKSAVFALISVAFLAIVSLLFFFPDDVQGNVLQQADIQQGLANGQEVKAYAEQTGESSRWTNSLFSGMPNFQISPSYASSSLLDWVAKLYTLWLPSPANLLFAMMLGFFIMCLCFRFKWYNALFGALAWGFSTYFIILIGAGHIWKFVTLAYIPPTIGGLALCYRGRYLGGAALTALFGALQLQSNHPQMTYYFLFVVLAMVIAWLINAVRQKEMKRWGIATACVVGAGLVAVGANATSLYNSYEYSKETIRGRATELSAPDAGGATKGLDKDYITGWSYGVDETLTLLIPNVKGGATIKPVGGENRILSLDQTDRGQQYGAEEQYMLQQVPQYFGDQPMTNGPVYVGAFVLLLAVLYLFVGKGPMRWALFAVTVLAIFLSWGHNFMWFSDLFIDHFPLYNKFRTVSSILVIVEFTIPLLAILCLREIISTPDFFKRYSLQFYCIFGIGAVICLIGWVAPGFFGNTFSANEMDFLRQQGALGNPQFAGALGAIQETRRSLVSADSLRSFIFILLAFGLLMLYFKKSGIKPAWLVCGLGVLLVLDLVSVNKRYVNSDNFVEPYEEAPFQPTAADVRILKDTAQNYRVLDIPGMTAARSSYFHKTIGGYHAAKLTRYNDLLEHQIAKNNMAVLNMLNAKYVIMQGDTVVQNPDAMGNAWFVDHIRYVSDANTEMKALDSLDPRRMAVADRQFEKVLKTSAPAAAGDTIFETTYAPNRLTYHSRLSRPRIAVFSEIYFPWGWQATVDGKPVEIGRVNYVLRALNLPAGNHTVTFEFKPQSVERAESISVASIILIYIVCLGALACVVGRRYMPRRKKHDGGNTEVQATE
ncbi:MAG: YfhO family protein [Porphyromonadaceae bacterium]|nr:YfhO family protein [Porphyromonadaceae bacterium]